MGFGYNAFAKVKSVQRFDKYSTCQITITKKNNGKYDLVFSGFIRLLGEAHKKPLAVDDIIQIKSCDVTNVYTVNGELRYNKTPVFIVFDFEKQASKTSEFVPSVDKAVVGASFIDDFEEVNFGEEIPF